MTISRQVAGSRAVYAQAAALFLLASAGALGFLPVAQVLTPKPEANVPVPSTEDGAESLLNQDSASTPEIDITLARSVLQEINGHVDPPEVEPEPMPEEPVAVVPEQPAPPPAPPAHQWKYLGAVVGPTAVHAMVDISGEQKLIAAGGEHDGTTLVSVHRGYIKVRGHDGGDERIDLAPRSEEASWAFGTSVAPPPPPQSPNTPNVNGKGGANVAGNVKVGPIRPGSADQAALAAQQAAAVEARRAAMTAGARPIPNSKNGMKVPPTAEELNKSMEDFDAQAIEKNKKGIQSR